MGWLTILGTISRLNSANPFVRRSKRGRGRKEVARRMPTSRMPRCRNDPTRAPMAAP